MVNKSEAGSREETQGGGGGVETRNPTDAERCGGMISAGILAYLHSLANFFFPCLFGLSTHPPPDVRLKPAGFAGERQ